MRGVNIGELDRRVNLFSYTETQSSTGQAVKTFTLYKAVWAKVEYGGGSEAITSDAPTPMADLYFIVRYDANITEKTRVEYRGVKYNITHIEEVERKVYLKLTASKPDNV